MVAKACAPPDRRDGSRDLCAVGAPCAAVAVPCAPHDTQPFVTHATEPGVRHLLKVMPTYYFHVIGTDNGDGQELPDDAAARAEAAAAFGEMISQDKALTELRMEVRDGAGRRVATLTYSVS